MVMNHNMTDIKEVFIMMLIMFIAGLLSSMNNWVDKISDIQFHLNNIYMSLLMCGWSLIMMGIYYIHFPILCCGLISILIIYYCIRKQLFINESQYLKGMIPHHSMAIFMSNRLLEKNKNIKILPKINKLATNIINIQKYEIKFMKAVLDYTNNK